MAIASAERDERLEERAKALGQTANYCPFGCGTEDLDEYGYCHHLVGFTNDGKVVETIQVRYRKVKDSVTGEVTLEDSMLRYVSGSKKLKHLGEVLAGDKLVNPERVERDKGIVQLVKAWVSSRVYRPEKVEKAVESHFTNFGIEPFEGPAPKKKPAAKKKKPTPNESEKTQEVQEVA